MSTASATPAPSSPRRHAITKKALSLFVRSKCLRQLRLHLTAERSGSTDPGERNVQLMPDPQPPRPGLQVVHAAGMNWQAEKLADLEETFPAGVLITGSRSTAPSGRTQFGPLKLAEGLATAQADRFLVESTYGVVDSFKAAVGTDSYAERHSITIGEVRPDLIQVLAPMRNHPGITSWAVTPRGDRTRLPADDTRLRLRVIDIKLTSEPAANYFAEIAYYAMTLSAWVGAHGFGDRFVVVSEGAVWPGTHDASRLRVALTEARKSGKALTLEMLRDELERELELVPFDVFAQTVRRFFGYDVPRALDSADWQTLPWHVDNGCRGCDYLGYAWREENKGVGPFADQLCYHKAASSDHLSRVAFMTRGSNAALVDGGVATVAELATRQPRDAVFNEHQSLKAQRSVVSGRAVALATGVSRTAPDAGTSAVMPKWADLRIHISVDFDPGSAISLAFTMKAFWIEPTDFGNAQAKRRTQSWRTQSWIVDTQSIDRERNEFFAFLEHLHSTMAAAQSGNPGSTVQIYIWDTLQYEHLVRVVGRHLEPLRLRNNIRHLAWLFPPEEILPNPELADNTCPITIVRDAVRALVQAPIPHYYNLLALAREYHSQSADPDWVAFNVHPLFFDPLSDQVPAERAHAIWSRTTAAWPWTEQLETLRKTVATRLNALEMVQKRIEEDLRATLQRTAPAIANLTAPDRVAAVSLDGQMWVCFSQLNAALTRLETQLLYSMPPHEREARFSSARLTERLTGDAERQALALLGTPAAARQRTYRLSAESRDFKVRERDFLFALSPIASQNFLTKKLGGVVAPSGLADGEQYLPVQSLVQVTVVRVDRESGLIVLSQNDRAQKSFDQLEAMGINLSSDVMLDPITKDYHTEKLIDALKEIGNPLIATTRAHVTPAAGVQSPKRVNKVTPPIADFLWDCKATSGQTTDRDLVQARAAISAVGVRLNDSQWRAWDTALKQRFALIWGPPGTGKSQTARAVIAGAVAEAMHRKRPLRVLITGATYNAVDRVLLQAHSELLSKIGPAGSVAVHRLRSKSRQDDAAIPTDIDTEVDAWSPSETVIELRTMLLDPTEGGKQARIVIVGGTQTQVHHLMCLTTGSKKKKDRNPAQQSFFDLVLIDEASQMDVGQAIVALTSMAAGCSLILVGDDKQLPPIHQAVPPRGLENVVGSIYGFARHAHGIEPVMLEENYRSSEAIVAFARDHAAYQPTLRSVHPSLEVQLASPVPTSTEPPPNWPAHLPWSSELSILLDQKVGASCFVYEDGRSSQSNAFESDLVASLIFLLGQRLTNRLAHDPRPSGDALGLYDVDKFWTEGVGIVTPHKAQQSLIISRLQQAFPTVNPKLIRGAVDTVERFQGQERDVILASYALGDPDAIAMEDEFLMGFNRFNVTASRARAKVLLLVSQEVVDHLCAEIEALHGSSLLKAYVDSYCRNYRPMTLPVRVNGAWKARSGTYRWR